MMETKVIFFNPFLKKRKNSLKTVRGLSKDEKEVLEQCLAVMRKGDPLKAHAVKFTIRAHFDTLPGGIYFKNKSLDEKDLYQKKEV